MSLRAIVAGAVRVVIASSPIAQELSVKMGLRKKRKKKKVERRKLKVLYINQRDLFP